MELVLTGVWKQALETFPELKRKIPGAINAAILQEANDLRKRMVKQFREQKPASGTWSPLSQWTLRARKVQGFNGRKILIRTGDLRGSIAVQVVGDGVVFVGVHRSAGTVQKGNASQQSSAGKKAVSFKAITPSAAKSKEMALVNLGLIHEFGATVRVKVTRAMQRYLFGVLLRGRRAGRDLGGRFTKKGAKPASSGTFKLGAVLTIRIPARPFVGPAIEAKSQREYEASVAARMAVILNGKLGKP